MVHRRLGQGISHFGEFYSPRSPKLDQSASHPEVLPIGCISLPIVNVTLQMRRSWNIARCVDVGLTCVDMRPSLKTDVLLQMLKLNGVILYFPKNVLMVDSCICSQGRIQEYSLEGAIWRARAYNGGLGAVPPAGSRGRAPGQGIRMAKPPEAERFLVLSYV